MSQGKTPEPEANLSVDNMQDEMVLKRFDSELFSTIDMPSESRYTHMKYYLQELPLSSYTRSETYNALHSIHPLGVQASIANCINDAIELTDHENDTKVISSIQDNFWKFAPEAMPNVTKRYSNALRKDGAASLERSIGGMVLEVEAMLDEGVPSYGQLDPHRGNDATSLDWYKVWGNDMKPFTDNGYFSFNGPKEVTAAYTLPDSEDIQENLIGMSYILPIIKKKLKPSIASARESYAQAETEALEKLYNNIHKLPSDLRTNVILDHALKQKDPSRVVRQTIYDSVKRDIKRGKVNSYREIAIAWKKQNDGINAAIAERMQSYV